MNGSTDLEGVHGAINVLDLEWALSQAARLPRFQLDDEVLRREMRWPFVFMVVFHCPWGYGKSASYNPICMKLQTFYFPLNVWPIV